MFHGNILSIGYGKSKSYIVAKIVVAYTSISCIGIGLRPENSKISVYMPILYHLFITSSSQVLFHCWPSKTMESWTQVWQRGRRPAASFSGASRRPALTKLFCLFRHGMKSCRCKTRNRSFCAWIKENCLTAFVYFFL